MIFGTTGIIYTSVYSKPSSFLHYSPFENLSKYFYEYFLVTNLTSHSGCRLCSDFNQISPQTEQELPIVATPNHEFNLLSIQDPQRFSQFNKIVLFHFYIGASPFVGTIFKIKWCIFIPKDPNFVAEVTSRLYILLCLFGIVSTLLASILPVTVHSNKLTQNTLSSRHCPNSVGL